MAASRRAADFPGLAAPLRSAAASPGLKSLSPRQTRNDGRAGQKNRITLLFYSPPKANRLRPCDLELEALRFGRLNPYCCAENCSRAASLCEGCDRTQISQERSESGSLPPQRCRRSAELRFGACKKPQERQPLLSDRDFRAGGAPIGEAPCDSEVRSQDHCQRAASEFGAPIQLHRWLSSSICWL